MYGQVPMLGSDMILTEEEKRTVLLELVERTTRILKEYKILKVVDHGQRLN